MSRPSVTIQLCTYNRAALLRRVLQGCFEQSVAEYEVVVVNDGSNDETEAVLDEARERAPIRFKSVTHTNRGLARSRNVGIDMAVGQRIIFIDDDVLPMPNFVEQHLATARRHPKDVIRGGVIMTKSFERLPPPYWSLLRDYSGNFFWTSNVSVPVEVLRRVGAFNENFREYGWEDIELGLRLRGAGLRSILNPQALAFHYKPALAARNVGGMVAQARAQARTAGELARLHTTWRVPLATADEPIQQALHTIATLVRPPGKTLEYFAELPPEQLLNPAETRAARALASVAYFDELRRARSFARTS
jgi:GT2 family glycosyltransferase